MTALQSGVRAVPQVRFLRTMTKSFIVGLAQIGGEISKLDDDEKDVLTIFGLKDRTTS